jgi:predicted RNA methylase
MIELLIFLLLFYIVISIVIYSLKIGISPMFSSFKVTTFILQKINTYDKNIIVDLGSGWGIFALIIAKNNPNKKIIGYELSPFPYYFSILLKTIFQIKNLEFYRKDFLKEEFSSDVLYYTYLFPKGMENLETKLVQNKQKLLLLSSTFALPKSKAFSKNILDDLFKTPIYTYKL